MADHLIDIQELLIRYAKALERIAELPSESYYEAKKIANDALEGK